MSDDFAPIHPGEILLEEYLKPLKISQAECARRIDVPRMRVTRLCAYKADLNADMARRLGIFTQTSTQFWLNLQATYERDLAEALDDKAFSNVKPITQEEYETV
jgi:addiction module HigA family antidote